MVVARRARVLFDVAWLAEALGFRGLCGFGEIVAGPARARPTEPPPAAALSELGSADGLLTPLRSRWDIENRLNWVIDLIFGDGGSQAGADNAR